MLDLIKLAASREGERLVATLRRLVESEGLPITQVISQATDHLERMERISKRRGKSVKEVAEEALNLYEREAK